MAGIVVLSPPTLEVEPGGQAVCTVQIRNTAPVVDQFAVTVLGDAADWATVTPPTLSLFPNGEGVVLITFAPARRADIPQGSVPFAVRVVPSEDPDGAVVEEGTLGIGGFSELTGRVVPRTSEGRKSARVRVHLENSGNSPLDVELSASDPDEALVFEMRNPEVTVPPGSSLEVPVNVAARVKLAKGQPQPRMFQVRADSNTGVPLFLDATFNQKSGNAGGFFLKAAVGVAAIVVLAAVLPGLLKKDDASSTRSLVQPTGATTPTSVVAEDEEGEADAAEDGGEGGGDEASADAGAEGPTGSAPTRLTVPPTTERVRSAGGDTQTTADATTTTTTPKLRPKAGLPVLFPSFEGDTDEEIWKVNPDGTGKTKLTNFAQPIWSVSPRWNWAGTFFAFTHADSAGVHVWIAGPNGEKPHDATPGTASAHQAAWSPDGTHLAYARNTGGQNDIWVADVDASGQTSGHRAVITTAEDEQHPTWSPGGEAIGYQRNTGGVWQVWSTPVDASGAANGAAVQLTSGASHNHQPNWSTIDANQMVFVSQRDTFNGAPDNEIYLLTVSSKQVTRVTNALGAGDEFPAFSPDGTRIAFSTTRFGSNTRESFEVVVATLDGTIERRLTTDTQRQWLIGWL